MRLSIEDGVLQSTLKTVSMEKDHAAEKEDTIMLQKPSQSVSRQSNILEDSEEINYTSNKETNLYWEEEDTKVR